ncbi:amidohydrolase [Clostridium malenominatum]|uniref:Amidohydrolase n=1 Tax=Clostridium malenominatum TaxID=1539 RepID=A0ABN1J3C7_9CLOT
MSGILIKNVNILTMNEEKTIIPKGVVAISGNIILEVGDSTLEEKYKDFITIDGEDGILMPGMVNCHTHAAMVPFRSLADDCGDRLRKYLFPLEQKLVDRELVAIGAKYALCEMLLGGVTTFCDMYYFEDEVAKVSKKMGVRAVLGETVVNFPAPDSKKPYGGLCYGEEFIKSWMGDDLITPAIAPHAPYSNDEISLKKAHKLSKKYNIPMIMHVAEMDFEYLYYKEQYSLSPVKYLNSLGILDENFIGAHMILLDEGDLDILQSNGVGVSHNMGANSKGAKGVAPVLEMYKRGMKIGLGTDGPMSGNTLDIITQMALVGKVHKLYNKDRTILPAHEIVEMATIGGARALNLGEKIGSIEVGKKADLVLIETTSVNMQPIYDYYSTIVYSANPSNVHTVIVDGKILVRDKQLIGIDFLNVKKELLNLRDKVETIAKEM